MSGAGHLTDEDRAEIARLPLFAGLDGDGLAAALVRAQVKTPKRGTMLFHRGDSADHFYVLLSGRVKLFDLTADGAEGVLEICDPVSTFAEAAVFAGGRFPVNAEVLQAARLVKIAAATFLDLIAQRPGLGSTMLQAMARREHQLVEQIAGLKLQSGDQRLASYILSLIDEDGAATADLHLPLEKGLLAARLGMKPESLSRSLKRFGKVGVRVTGRRLSIGDVAALRALLSKDG